MHLFTNYKHINSRKELLLSFNEFVRFVSFIATTLSHSWRRERGKFYWSYCFHWSDGGKKSALKILIVSIKKLTSFVRCVLNIQTFWNIKANTMFMFLCCSFKSSITLRVALNLSHLLRHRLNCPYFRFCIRYYIGPITMAANLGYVSSSGMVLVPFPFLFQWIELLLLFAENWIRKFPDFYTLWSILMKDRV